MNSKLLVALMVVLLSLGAIQAQNEVSYDGHRSFRAELSFTGISIPTTARKPIPWAP